jgi:hypothetical protein
MRSLTTKSVGIAIVFVVIDASAEARLVYPSGQRLLYQSREGTRQLIEMSGRQVPGFTAYLAIPANNHRAFRWFDDQLQALGWQPFDADRFHVVQASYLRAPPGRPAARRPGSPDVRVLHPRRLWDPGVHLSSVCRWRRPLTSA